MLKHLISILIFSIVLSLNIQAGNKDDHPEWKVAEQDGYIIKYPTDWKYLTSKNKQIEFYLLAPYTPQDKFGENVTISIENLSDKETTLERFTSTALGKIRHYVDGSEIISSEPVTIKKTTFQVVEYTASYPNTEGVYWMQYYFLKNGKAYIVTAMIENSKKESYFEVMKEILNSFKFTKQKKSPKKSS